MLGIDSGLIEILIVGDNIDKEFLFYLVKIEKIKRKLTFLFQTRR